MQMAATSGGSHQQQHKLSRSAAVMETAALIMTRNQRLQSQHQQQQQRHHHMMQQQQTSMSMHSEPKTRQHFDQLQQQQLHQHQQQKYLLQQKNHEQHQQRGHLANGQQQQRQNIVTRVVTNLNAAAQQQPQQNSQQQKKLQKQQQQQPTLPAGLVNGNNSSAAVGNTVFRPAQSNVYQQQQLQQLQEKLLPKLSQQEDHVTNVRQAATRATTPQRLHEALRNNLAIIPAPGSSSDDVSVLSSTSAEALETTATATATTLAVANLAPGWQRLHANNEIVYVSPTGSTLRTAFQIKDYLLSQGTCKCGLPCPLRPELFFDFNAQVPDMALKVPTHENNFSAQHTTALTCLHQKRFLDSQKMHVQRSSSSSSSSSSPIYSSVSSPSSSLSSAALSLSSPSLSLSTSLEPLVKSPTSSGKHTTKGNKIWNLILNDLTNKIKNAMQSGAYDGKRRKLSSTATLLSMPAPKAIYSHLQPTSQLKPSGKTGIAPGTTPNLQQHVISTQSTAAAFDRRQIAAGQNPKKLADDDASYPRQIGSVTLSKTPPWYKTVTPYVEERVPPLIEDQLPPTILDDEDFVTGWQFAKPRQSSPSLFTDNGNCVKSCLSAPAKKQPNFKDDPAGYLQEQTALLHSSMMNVVIEEDEDDEDAEDDFAFDEVDMELEGEYDDISNDLISLPVMKSQKQSAPVKRSHQQRPDSHCNGKQPSNSFPSHGCVQSGSHFCHPPKQQHNQTQQQQQPPQRKAVHIVHQDHQEHQQASHASGQTPTASQTLKQTEKQPNKALPAFQTHPLATTLGGQTITPLSNGLVHIERSAEVSGNKLKPQQHLQLQQQIQQHNMFYRRNLQQQHHQQKPVGVKLVKNGQESPVSSSTAYHLATPDVQQRRTPDDSNSGRGAGQSGTVSTTNDSPRPGPVSPADNVCSGSLRVSGKVPPTQSVQQQHVVIARSGQKTSAQSLHAKSAQKTTQRIVSAQRNSLTTVAGGRAATTTTASTAPTSSTGHMHKIAPNSGTNNISVSNVQLQPVVHRSNDSVNSQLIMTSNGQVIVMPANGKAHVAQQPQQVIITAANSSNVVQQQPNATSVIIHQQPQQQHSVDVISGQQLSAVSNSSIILQNNHQHQGSYIVSQPTTTTASATQLQPTTVILNSTGQNLLTSGGAKVLSSSGANIIHAGNQHIIAPGNHQLLGQQAVVLNTLPNGGYVIQQTSQQQQPTSQQYTTLDGQVVSQFMQPDGRTTYVQPATTGHQQQPQQRVIKSSADANKRKTKKRKTSSSPSAPSSTSSPTISPQISPTIPNQPATIIQQQPATINATAQPQVIQIAASGPQYQQQFQLSPGIQGIVVNKTPTTQSSIQSQPQQILLQNGQLLQPMNLIGQQLLVAPAGMVMAPEGTLLQIQNVGSCGTSILTATPQATMMLRTPSPQNKQFLSPNTAGQQFIVGSNGQLSPIGQIYSTPVGLMMPQQNPGTTTFVQQNGTIQLQQQQQMSLQQAHLQQQHLTFGGEHVGSESGRSSLGGHRLAAASPPDTTTRSPRSPERPASNRSGGSDMVQWVSSSEPDGAVSPQSVENRHSPSTTDCERGVVMSTSYRTANIYKQSEAKIRRVQSPLQYRTTTNVAEDMMPSPNGAAAATGRSLNHHRHHQQPYHSDVVKPDTSESPSNSAMTTSTSTTPPTSKVTAASSLPRKQQLIRRQPSNPKTPNKQMRQRVARTAKTTAASATTTAILLGPPNSEGASAPQMRSFAVGELIFGTARGYPAWPGKVVRMPDGVCSPSLHSDHVWVQWFGGGGRSSSELVAANSLQSLSEGLDAHHKAQKDTRKSRKLNSQLERAIQEAMTELDRISAPSPAKTTAPASSRTPQVQHPTSTSHSNGSPNRLKRGASRYMIVSTSSASSPPAAHNPISTTTAVNNTTTQRSKPIRIAPAPPTGTHNSASKAHLNLYPKNHQQSLQSRSK